MKENAVSLEDVVVVGYGVQKKVNVTGAVSMVKAEAIENRPITNVTTGYKDCCLELVLFPLRAAGCCAQHQHSWYGNHQQ